MTNMAILLVFCAFCLSRIYAQDFSAVEMALNAANEFTDVAVIIGNTGGRLFEYTKGSASLQQAYPSASSIKWVTSMVVLRLVEEGKLSLDDNPSMYLDYWNTTDGRKDITVRQLLSFTSGFRGQPFGLETPFCFFQGSITIDECTREVHDEWFFDTPGAKYYYGPSHMQILASIAQNVTGQSWQEVFLSRVAIPIGMQSTLYSSPSLTNPRVSGGAVTNANDMDAFLQAMLTRSNSLLSPALWAEMVTDNTPTQAVTLEFTPITKYEFHYGLGVWKECAFPTWQPSCDPLTIVSTTGSTGIHGWVDYVNEYYGLIVTDLGLGSADISLDFAIEELREPVLSALSAAGTPQPTSSSSRMFDVSIGKNTCIILAFVFLLIL